MPINKQIILGITGQMASGKGTTATYLKNTYGASTYGFSTMLMDILNRLYLPHSRDNLVALSEILRKTFGEDTMARAMAYDVEKDKNTIIVVEGIRRLADIAYLKKLKGFILVEITADIKTRYERLIQRREKPDDATKTYEQFVADHDRSTEKSIYEVIEHATESINNNKNLDHLKKQIDNVIKKYTG